MRLLVLTNIVPPYREPVFNALGDALGDDFGVLCLAQGEGNRNWKLDRERLRFRADVLPGVQLRGRRPDRIVHANAFVSATLARRRPDVIVIGGFDQPAFFEAMGAARLLGIAPVLWSGAHRYTSTERAPLTQLKRGMVRASKAFLSYGTLAAEYLETLGAPRDRIVVGQNAVDVSAFAKRDPAASQAFRDQHGLQGKTLLLYVGQLIARKGVDVVIEAAGLAPDVHLVVVGSGPDEAALKALADQHCRGRATFTGSIGYSQLPAVYGACDLFVMPSRSEVWGLVLNEAMAAGLPVLASREAGATRDLVQEGVEGFAIDPTDPAMIAERITRLAVDRTLREKAGKAAASRIAAVTPERYANDMLEAARRALA